MLCRILMLMWSSGALYFTWMLRRLTQWANCGGLLGRGSWGFLRIISGRTESTENPSKRARSSVGHAVGLM